MRQRALNAAGLRSAENDGMHVYLAGIPSHQERGELAQRDSLISDLQAMRQVACPAARLAVPAQCQQAPPCGQAPAQGGPFTAHISNDVTAAPPAEEKILVKHVYSECNEDGFWHVVEDTWYDAGGGRIYKRRTYDQKTDQPCRDGDGRSVPESPKVRQLVSREIAPQEFGEAVEDGLIVEVRCENGLWYRYTFKRYRLKDGSYRRHHTPERVEGTGKRCDEPMPSPVGGSVIIIDAPPLEGTDAARRAPLKIGPATGDSSRRLTPYAQ